MERGMNKAVIVTRKTRLTLLAERYNTVEQARFYIEHMGEDFSDYVTEDRNYREAVLAVTEAASRFARVQTVDRSFVPSMVFGRDDAVIAVGQDGTVANVMKYLSGQPLLGVNPDPARWDGVLLPFEAGEIAQLLPKVFSGCYNRKDITMAEAVTRDGQTMLAVNDFFIGIRSHASARYRITFGAQQENQSSSGIIVSTGLGSTGWYRSILAEADGIARLFGGGADPLGYGFSPLSRAGALSQPLDTGSPCVRKDRPEPGADRDLGDAGGRRDLLGRHGGGRHLLLLGK